MFFKKFTLDLQFFAHKKGGGSASTNRSHDSKSKRLGVKIYAGEKTRGGNIIIRQRGTHFKCDEGTYLGRDYTIHAKFDGIVFYKKKKKGNTFVGVFPTVQTT